jgi:hypothetical protein
LKLNKKNLTEYSHYLIYGSVASIIFAAIGWLGPDIWLASTQWLLVALVLAVYAIYIQKE